MMIQTERDGRPMVVKQARPIGALGDVSMALRTNLSLANECRELAQQLMLALAPILVPDDPKELKPGEPCVNPGGGIPLVDALSMEYFCLAAARDNLLDIRKRLALGEF